jgi:glucosyl-3-phosphoglycerate synthase
MAQADIGERRHRHPSDAALGRMGAEVLAAALRRHRDSGSERLVQFARSGDGFEATTTTLHSGDLPPVVSLTEEQAS